MPHPFAFFAKGWAPQPPRAIGSPPPEIPATRRPDAKTVALSWRRLTPHRIGFPNYAQQTRVAVVIERYNTPPPFPTVQKLPLANPQSSPNGADSATTGAATSAAAKIIAAKIPHAESCALPGISRYTAAAIASIAFKHPVAVVARASSASSVASTKNAHPEQPPWTTPNLSIPPAPAISTAMMELGATVCLLPAPMCCRPLKTCRTRRR